MNSPMRQRRRLDEAEQEALRDAVRKAFNAEEETRDREHDEQVNRLLGHLDSFTRGEGNGSGHPA